MKEAFNLVSITNEDGSMPNLEKVSQGMKFIAFLTADSITGDCNCDTKHDAFDSAMNSFAYYRAQTERLILLGLGRDARCRDYMQTWRKNVLLLVRFICCNCDFTYLTNNISHKHHSGLEISFLDTAWYLVGVPQQQQNLMYTMQKSKQIPKISMAPAIMSSFTLQVYSENCLKIYSIAALNISQMSTMSKDMVSNWGIYTRISAWR